MTGFILFVGPLFFALNLISIAVARTVASRCCNSIGAVIIAGGWFFLLKEYGNRRFAEGRVHQVKRDLARFEARR